MTVKTKKTTTKNKVSMFSLRIFDALSGVEENGTWKEEDFKQFETRILNDLPNDGSIVHFGSYRQIYRCIRNYDMNELHLFWSPLLEYSPVKDCRSIADDIAKKAIKN
ncbi:MAG: hypothetical protein GY694_15485 [Gammaproteobacteria bacterium]|nr:hypothetical protein [Gammaproteobacteria bacterium]